MPDKTLTPAELKRRKLILRSVNDWLQFRGMSQRQVADALGVSESTVSKWLRGGQAMNNDRLLAIATLLRVSLSELLAGPQNAENARITEQVAEIANALTPEALNHWLETGRMLAQRAGARDISDET